MHLNTWNEFRHEIYNHCLLRAKDALFNTADALMTETRAKSLPEVTQSDASLNASGRRSTKPLKMAGSISRRGARVFLRYLPADYVGRWLWIGIDTTGIARPRARTARDRSALPVHNLPDCEKPITWGWQFSTGYCQLTFFS